MAWNKIKLKAMSLEELLIVLALTGVVTLVMMDAWRMINDIRRRLLRRTDAVVEVFDSLAHDRNFIQEELDRKRLDSLMTLQNKNEKTNE